MFINGNAPRLRAWGVFYGLFAPFGAENVIFSHFWYEKCDFSHVFGTKLNW